MHNVGELQYNQITKNAKSDGIKQYKVNIQTLTI